MIELSNEMKLCLAGAQPKCLGIAVSGGSDSTALLVLLANWAKTQDVTLSVATVNHGLRPEAKAEAEQVARLCNKLKTEHQTLHWTGWDGKGNLQDMARRARHELLSDWAMHNRIDVVALGHTQDDQAETVLMRLLRGSGVDGLAGIARIRHFNNIRWIRPLLRITRQDLRDCLVAQNIPWTDDPSNQDTRFGRIRVRKLLVDLGFSKIGLAETAERMQEARQYLEAETHRLACDIVKISKAGDVEIDQQKLFAEPVELRQRVLAHSLKWVVSSPYRPRLDGLRRLLTGLENGQKSTLLGCTCEVTKHGLIRIAREYSAVKDLRCSTEKIWDHRWSLKSNDPTTDCTIAALGEAGLGQCLNWRDTGLARDSLLASPGIWRSGVLISAPIAGWPQHWRAELANGANSYYSTILSH